MVITKYPLGLYTPFSLVRDTFSSRFEKIQAATQVHSPIERHPARTRIRTNAVISRTPTPILSVLVDPEQ